MNEFTKGEWEFLEYYTVWCEDTQKFEDISLVHFINKENQAVEIARTNPILPHEEQIANARLIAAAPELYEACKDALVLIPEASVKFEHKHHHIGQELLTKAFRAIEAALAKVEEKP